MRIITNIKYQISDVQFNQQEGLFPTFGAAESNIQKKEHDYKKREGNLHIGIKIGKIHNDSLSANRKATSKHTIAPATSIVNTTLLDDSDKSEKLGSMSAAPIQPAAKLVNKPESTFNLGLENNFINYNHNTNNYQYQMSNSESIRIRDTNTYESK